MNASMHTTSITLLERLRTPADGVAWERFVDLYTPLLYYWAKKCGLQSQDAADLIQDVFALLVRKMPEFRYDAGKSFRSWLRMVTENLWRDRLRAVATRPLSTLEGRADRATADHTLELEESEYRSHLVRRALELMQRDFQPSTWRAVWDHTVVGRPAAEVATLHGLSVAAVYSANFRVMSRLRQELDGLLD